MKGIIFAKVHSTWETNEISSRIKIANVFNFF